MMDSFDWLIVVLNHAKNVQNHVCAKTAAIDPPIELCFSPRMLAALGDRLQDVTRTKILDIKLLEQPAPGLMDIYAECKAHGKFFSHGTAYAQLVPRWQDL